MILKVRTEKSWVYFGDVEKAETIVDAQESLLDSCEIYGETSAIQDEKKSGKIIRIETAKRERFILGFLAVYLLNDEGKTIERLN